MLKLQINNNYIYVILVIRTQLCHRHITLNRHIQNVEIDKYIVKEIVHHHIVLLQLVQLLIDGVETMILISHYYLHKDHCPVIKPLIKVVKVDLYQGHQIMLRFMDWLNNHVLIIILNYKHINNVRKRLNHVKSLKLAIIVYLNNQKILNNKYLIMVQLLLLFQFLEIS